ncbi:MAG TPA: hypothetical protein VHK88_16735 [Aquihabitans sp.]|nr:hypothetical protein [Aquihabitans sp.]
MQATADDDRTDADLEAAAIGTGLLLVVVVLLLLTAALVAGAPVVAGHLGW